MLRQKKKKEKKMRNVITKEMKIYIQQQNQFVWKERNILSIVPNSLISIIWSSGQTYVEWKGEEIIDDGYLRVVSQILF